MCYTLNLIFRLVILNANERIVVLGYSIIVLTTRRYKIIQIDRSLPWLLDFHLTTNIGKLLPRSLNRAFDFRTPEFFVKLVLKIRKKFFDARVTSILLRVSSVLFLFFGDLKT